MSSTAVDMLLLTYSYDMLHKKLYLVGETVRSLDRESGVRIMSALKHNRWMTPVLAKAAYRRGSLWAAFATHIFRGEVFHGTIALL